MSIAYIIFAVLTYVVCAGVTYGVMCHITRDGDWRIISSVFCPVSILVGIAAAVGLLVSCVVRRLDSTSARRICLLRANYRKGHTMKIEKIEKKLVALKGGVVDGGLVVVGMKFSFLDGGEFNVGEVDGDTYQASVVLDKANGTISFKEEVSGGRKVVELEATVDAVVRVMTYCRKTPVDVSIVDVVIKEPQP